ncbi:acireductone dioxygenase [uncultured Pseudomonas sp.]|uniref:1,2-dihydroxy-3-keto-5-methylthiopentene dioxygenase n=1 Tax=uncultured Pseudomonas sp. TaxID=114707 RepID=UPI00262B833F|nr:acireductone dioxygenase [uncultured Pseudomonas sp.]
MSCLTVYHQSSPEHPNKLLSHVEDIASTLAAVGVQFSQVAVQQPVIAGTASAEVIAASRVQIDQLMSTHGYAAAEVLSLCDERGEGSELARALRQEQLCPSAHLHYYLAGRGVLALHIGEYVYSLLCEKNDLVLLPAGTAHWFDAGEHPRFAVLRVFDSPQVPALVSVAGDFAAAFAGLDDC